MLKNRMQAVSALLAILTVATLLTGVLAANSLLAMGSSTPTATLSIPAISDTGSASARAEKAATEGAALVLLGASAERGASVVTLDAVIRDGKTVWSGETQIDIFSIAYDNAAGTTTVQSAYGDKVIAPGTSDQYYFRIENNGNVSVNYSMTAEGSASFTLNGQDYTIPVQVKLSDSSNAYLAGSKNSWVDVEELNTVADSGTLSAGHYTQYTLDWQWLFEQEDTEAGDAFDTMLGNLSALDEDLLVTVRFMVTASNATDPNAAGGLPKTGDSSHVALWFALMVLSLCGIIFLLSRKKKEQ